MGSPGRPLFSRWRGQPLRSRWRRWLRDTQRSINLRAWLPAVAGTTLVSGGVLAASALQSEQFKNELLAGFERERLAQTARHLSDEARDWAVWDETFRHAQGRNPAYFQRNYNSYSFARTPFVAVLDPAGRLLSTARFDSGRQRLEPLGEGESQALQQLIPPGNPLAPLTFLARHQGRPYLMSAQPILPTSGQGPAAGRLLFVRALDRRGKDGQTLQRALGILREHFDGSPAGPAGPLGPLQVSIPHPLPQGGSPVQHTIVRRASERLGALQGIALLALLGSGSLAGLAARSYMLQRRYRQLTVRNRRHQRQLERDLQRHRQHDELTGLLSESGLLEAVARQRQHYADFLQVMLHIDLDHFDLVSNGLGRGTADQALTAFAQVLRQQLHASAAVARLSGHEFSCCLLGTSEAALRSEVSVLSQQLNDLDVCFDGYTITVTVSIGASVVGEAGPASALHQAAIACSVVKMHGGHSHQFFGDEYASTENYLTIQQRNEELLAAIRGKRIALFGQHAWLLSAGEQLPAVYVELLARIEDPESGTFSWSEDMIVAANFCGSLGQLDNHILQLACQNISTTLRQPALADGAHSLVYAINITPDTLLSADFVRRLDGLLERHGLDPQRICLEITEQAALGSLSEAINALSRLRKLGVRVSLDDFGAGMTSLGYLRDLPLDYVKIDKVFIRKLREDIASRLIVQFIVELGKEMGFQTIAEGVEDVDLLLLLQRLGVSIAQGYVATRPRPFVCSPEAWLFAQAGRALLEASASPGNTDANATTAIQTALRC